MCLGSFRAIWVSTGSGSLFQIGVLPSSGISCGSSEKISNSSGVGFSFSGGDNLALRTGEGTTATQPTMLTRWINPENTSALNSVCRSPQLVSSITRKYSVDAPRPTHSPWAMTSFFICRTAISQSKRSGSAPRVATKISIPRAFRYGLVAPDKVRGWKTEVRFFDYPLSSNL